MAELGTENIEKNDRSVPTAVKVGVAALIAAAATGYIYAEEIATIFVPEPDAPTEPTRPDKPETPNLGEEPTKPVKEKAQRPPIEVAIGVDVTRSKIRKQLPAIRKSLIEFFKQYKADLLQDGDSIDLCTFKEKADCHRFVLPDGLDDLMRAIRNIEVVPPGSRHNTHVAVSIGDILDFLNDSSEAIVAVWTDAIDEGETPDRPIPVQVNIAVPDNEYTTDASKVKEAMEGVPSCDEGGCEDINIHLAKTGTDFANLLKGFTDKLQQQAQALADEKAELKFQSDLTEYHRKKEEYQRKLEAFEGSLEAWEAELQAQKESYESALDKFSKDKAELKEKIQEIKNIIEGTLIGVCALITAILGLLIYLETRPRFRGWIIDGRNHIEKTQKLPGRGSKQHKHRVRLQRGEYLYLAAAKDGLILQQYETKGGSETPGKKIFDGGEIIPGVRYYSSLPKRNFTQPPKEDFELDLSNDQNNQGAATPTPDDTDNDVTGDEYGW